MGCQEGRPQGHDCNSSLQLRGLQHGLEGERREGRRGELHVGCSSTAEEEWVLQVRRRIEPEIEEEGRNSSSQRYQSFYKGAMCLQGEACVPDCEGPCTQTFQGLGQLISLVDSSCSHRVTQCLGGRSRQTLSRSS